MDAIEPDPTPGDRLVLLTAESAGNGAALTEFVERNAHRIALIVVSDIGGGAAGIVREGVSTYRRSGPGFIPYLYASWVHYYLAVRVKSLLGRSKDPAARRPLPELCKRHGIPTIREADVNAETVRERIAAERPDFVVSFVFDQILHEPLIAIAKRATINVHAACLPECRGPFPVLFSALEGPHATGVTIHEIVDRAIDSGPILARREVPIEDGVTVLYREHVLHCAAVDLLTGVLDDFDAHREASFPQEAGEYFSWPSRENIADAEARGIPLVSRHDLQRVSTETYAEAMATVGPAAERPVAVAAAP
jgi:folate-dependent phosphoribosylglycinamide formyltransferase PurN